MKASIYALLIIMFAVLINACSLLEIKLESGMIPLPQEQLNMRLFSRNFSHNFYSQVEQSADQIATLNDNKNQDIQIQSNTLLWKIHAEQALQKTIFQASPVAAMIDTWVLTSQLSNFFESGAGKTLFGPHQDVAI